VTKLFEELCVRIPEISPEKLDALLAEPKNELALNEYELSVARDFVRNSSLPK
jgi:hypothetical protein